MTAPSRPAPGTAPLDVNTPIQLVLTVGQINHVLHVLRTQPLGEVLDLFNSIQSQGNLAAAALQLGQGVANGEDAQSGETVAKTH